MRFESFLLIIIREYSILSNIQYSSFEILKKSHVCSFGLVTVRTHESCIDILKVAPNKPLARRAQEFTFTAYLLPGSRH